MNKKNRYIQKRFEKEKIVSRLLAKPGKHNLVLILDNLKPDFNIGKIYRTAEVFSIKEIHLIGIPFFDPIPSKGAFRKTPSFFYNSFKESYDRLISEGYVIYAFESKSSQYMHQAKFPKNAAFILGHEEFGVSFNRDEFPNIQSINIQQFGQAESLNVSVAASLSIYEYLRQNILETN